MHADEAEPCSESRSMAVLRRSGFSEWAEGALDEDLLTDTATFAPNGSTTTKV
jgi:hypothetical protein